MGARALVAITLGAHPGAWSLAAAEEQAAGTPEACSACPLRPGGEWDAGLVASLPKLSSTTREQLRCWGCHAKPRPCAGMRRHLAAKGKP